MAPSEVEAIDEWSHQHRVRTRSEAIRKLVAVGLKEGGRMAISDLTEAIRAIPASRLSKGDVTAFADLIYEASIILNKAISAADQSGRNA